MNENLKSNVTSAEHWLRFLYMLMFALFLYVAMIFTGVLVTIQFFFALFTGADNPSLRRVGDSLATYISQIIRFLTYNSPEKPFPFSDWPEPEEPEEVLEDEPVESETAEVVEEAPVKVESDVAAVASEVVPQESVQSSEDSPVKEESATDDAAEELPTKSSEEGAKEELNGEAFSKVEASDEPSQEPEQEEPEEKDEKEEEPKEAKDEELKTDSTDTDAPDKKP